MHIFIFQNNTILIPDYESIVLQHRETQRKIEEDHKRTMLEQQAKYDELMKR